MRADHTCPDDPFIDMWHGQHRDGDGEIYDGGCWDVSCAPHMEFHWDQWMVCFIHCLHGRAMGVACGINFMESFTKAVEKFNAYDHTQPTIERHDDEDYSDYRKRIGQTPLPREVDVDT